MRTEGRTHPDKLLFKQDGDGELNKMVLSFSEEKELLEMKQTFKKDDQAFQKEYAKIEHDNKMARLEKMHAMVKDGWKGREE